MGIPIHILFTLILKKFLTPVSRFVNIYFKISYKNSSTTIKRYSSTLLSKWWFEWRGICYVIFFTLNLFWDETRQIKGRKVTVEWITYLSSKASVSLFFTVTQHIAFFYTFLLCKKGVMRQKCWTLHQQAKRWTKKRGLWDAFKKRVK